MSYEQELYLDRLKEANNRMEKSIEGFFERNPLKDTDQIFLDAEVEGDFNMYCRIIKDRNIDKLREQGYTDEDIKFKQRMA